MDICSIWAYHEIVDSGWLRGRLAMYLSVFSAGTPLTARQATNAVRDKFGKGFECSSFVARCSDLEDMGFLKKDGRVQCEFTKKTVNKWKYTGLKVPLPKETITVMCNCCKGKGFIERETYRR